MDFVESIEFVESEEFVGSVKFMEFVESLDFFREIGGFPRWDSIAERRERNGGRGTGEEERMNWKFERKNDQICPRECGASGELFAGKQPLGHGFHRFHAFHRFQEGIPPIPPSHNLLF